MFSSFRNRFGIPGVISVIALVFAMFGGAYAANNSGGDATASAKGKQGKQGKRGKPGKPGATGPAGPAGPAGAKGDTGAQGPQGEKGDKGDKGDTGNNGGPGIAGKSVTGAPIATGGVCGDATGVKYTLDGTPTNVCSGEDGEDGEDGESGFTATLPPGATETGAWAFGPSPAGKVNLALSFAIPLASPLDSTQVHYINPAGQEVVVNFVEGEFELLTPTKCLGSATTPSAEPGHLCVYARAESSGIEVASSSIYDPAFVEEASEEGSAGTTGARLVMGLSGPGLKGWGAWAVTACGGAIPCP